MTMPPKAGTGEVGGGRTRTGEDDEQFGQDSKD